MNKISLLFQLEINYLLLLTFTFFLKKRSFRYENDNEKSKTKTVFKNYRFLKSSLFKIGRFKTIVFLYKKRRMVNNR